ncbi:hypothetical protein Nepgr_025050 [Nepenthes gracilis]|uniref:Kinesin-like protein n=1 Tax=Nepenthes gracilis TaxID=150966 RepID=A0AAD3T719_NEPGR|nr:hypothetical protein Nepgr_025050 [Nepenthes gracilis]
MEKICVAVRVRPPSPEEKINGTFWKVEDNRISLHRPLGTPITGVSYAFDHVFDQTCSNSRIYDLLTKDIIHASVEGFNGTVFAYGQTSSGKTFTMNGSQNDPGVIPRAVKEIFERIQRTNEREFLIRVSYMEIYNEEINDLLVVDNQKLQIHESLERGIFVAGLREEIVNDSEQVLRLLQAGEENRHFGETNMNVRSSRSHTIFRMVIESKRNEVDSSNDYSCSDAIRVSVLNLVDLAGSERIAKTGADGVRLKEGKHINKSLMVLGNVINKLSDGTKMRGHIPYRDSKLTRILQSALGGNAKTSIICTVAPEEVHIEETKGTLQFANRAKCITNCAQVNEILTDAALLKRQKLEIEELRKQLQGSRAEVLEQEILKLRNGMLKYELEREKLAMELEQERKLHQQRDQCIKEQQMKIDNLSHLVNFSDGDRKCSNQTQDFIGQCISEKSSGIDSISQEDAFSTPCFKAAPNAFVARRFNYSKISDSIFSPLPVTLSNVVDEDAWVKLNKGYVADLDSLHITPAMKVRSFSSGGASPGFTNDYYEQELQNLRKQLELATKDKHELEEKHEEQVLLNNQLNRELGELQKEVQVIRDIPQMLCESATTCRDIYEDILSVVQNSVADEKSFAAKFLSSISEIGINLFSTLESRIEMAMDGRRCFSGDNSLLQQQCKLLCERLNSTVTSLASSKVQSAGVKESGSTGCSCDYKGFVFGIETTCWKEKLSKELNTIKDKYICLEQKLDLNTQLLEASKEKYHDLEREFHMLKGERDSLFHKVSESAEKLALVSDQREMILKDYNSEVQKRKDLEEEIKRFSIAFASQQRSLASFHNEFKARVVCLRSLNSHAAPESLGC